MIVIVAGHLISYLLMLVVVVASVAVVVCRAQLATTSRNNNNNESSTWKSKACPTIFACFTMSALQCVLQDCSSAFDLSYHPLFLCSPLTSHPPLSVARTCYTFYSINTLPGKRQETRAKNWKTDRSDQGEWVSCSNLCQQQQPQQQALKTAAKIDLVCYIYKNNKQIEKEMWIH